MSWAHSKAICSHHQCTETPTKRPKFLPSLLDLPESPTTETKSVGTETPFTHIKHVFWRGSNEAKVIGREAEKQSLNDFWDATVKSRQGGSLYISGNPGTGKSAMLKRFAAEHKVCLI